MRLEDAITARGGVVRTSELRAARFSNHAIATAVASGAIVRPRGGWVATKGADPELVAAARAGVVLTCVSQARRLGLWVPSEDKAHVAAPSHSSGVRITRDATGRAKAVVHWSTPIVARHPGRLSDPVENVLALVAGCRPQEEALAVWDSALNKGLVDLTELRRLPLRGPAKQLLDLANPYSDSGLETFVPVRLRWLRVRIVPQAWIEGHRVDFLIGERLVLQIDGGTHVGPQREYDNRHDALLLLRGYHVIRVGYRQVVDDWPSVQDTITRAVAQGLHRAR